MICRTLFLALVGTPATVLAQVSVPIHALSAPVSTSADAFTNISSVRELSNGKVIVSDLVDKSEHLLDLGAGTSAQIGREGGGPGEYGFPGELLPLPGDTTLLVDRVNRRFLTILPNGAFRFAFTNLPGSGAVFTVIATTNLYTEKEDLHEADLILTCLGDPDGPKATLVAGSLGPTFDGVLHVAQLASIFN